MNAGTTYYFKVTIRNGAGRTKTLATAVSGTTIMIAPTITVENENSWKTGKKVTLTTVSGYTTRYTVNGVDPNAGNGTAYGGPFTRNENCTIKAAYVNNATGVVGEVATKQIVKIDNVEPTISLTVNSATKNSITVTASRNLSEAQE